MPTAEAQVETDRASRYLVQLCSHTSQMSRLRHRAAVGHGGGRMVSEVQDVDWSDTVGIVRFTGGQCTLRAGSDALTLLVEADDEETLQRLRAGVAGRLEKIGRRDGLKVTWRQADGATGSVRAPEGPEGSGAKRRATTLGLVAGGALVVALHVGLGGAALSASAWTGWAANGVLALVALKLVFMGAHVVLGRMGIRRGRAVAARRKPKTPTARQA